MILLAAALIAGDTWAWDITVRYDDPIDGPIQTERERWTVRIGAKDTLATERLFLGSLVDGTLIATANPQPEILKGTVETDGSLTVKGDWSDPASARALRRLLNPAKKLDDRLTGWPIVRRAVLSEPDARLPGSGIPARLTVEVSLFLARLGGKEIKLPTAAPRGGS